MMQFWIYTLSEKVKMEKKSKSRIRCTHTHAEKTHTHSQSASHSADRSLVCLWPGGCGEGEGRRCGEGRRGQPLASHSSTAFITISTQFSSGICSSPDNDETQSHQPTVGWSTCVSTSAMTDEDRAPRSLLLNVRRMAMARKTRIMTQPPMSLSQTPSRQVSGSVDAKHWLNHLHTPPPSNLTIEGLTATRVV